MNKEAGTPRTIDSKGNIVPKRYGVSRWDYPKKYPCGHEDCTKAAVAVRTVGKTHNCCTQH